MKGRFSLPVAAALLLSILAASGVASAAPARGWKALTKDQLGTVLVNGATAGAQGAGAMTFGLFHDRSHSEGAELCISPDGVDWTYLPGPVERASASFTFTVAPSGSRPEAFRVVIFQFPTANARTAWGRPLLSEPCSVTVTKPNSDGGDEVLEARAGIVSTTSGPLRVLTIARDLALGPGLEYSHQYSQEVIASLQIGKVVIQVRVQGDDSFTPYSAEQRQALLDRATKALGDYQRIYVTLARRS